MDITPIKLNVARKMRNRAYRLRFTEARLRDTIAATLRAERERLGMTQALVAQRARMKPSAVARLEASNRSPTIPTLVRWCDALGVRLEVTLKGS